MRRKENRGIRTSGLDEAIVINLFRNLSTSQYTAADRYSCASNSLTLHTGIEREVFVRGVSEEEIALQLVSGIIAIIIDLYYNLLTSMRYSICNLNRIQQKVCLFTLFSSFKQY